jgi:radical SAM-linked protein
MPFDKVRIRFRKNGDLRLVSHHDLMRAFERMLRRSGLPFRSSEGFHPQPRVVFAQSLPLGVAGLQEVVEIEWLEPIEPSEALARLTAQAPHGLPFLSAKRIELRQSAKPRRAVYRMPISAHCVDALRGRCADIMASSELWVERERPRPRQVNIRPYVNDLQMGSGLVQIDLWITQDGGARADELVRALGLNRLLDEGAVIERAVLEIEDEVGPADAAARPVLPGRNDRAALERPSAKSPAILPPPSAAPLAHWGASPSGPIVE